MSVQVWGTTHNGNIEYVSVTSKILENGLNVMRKSFFVDEKVCIGVELSREPKAASELEELCLRAARDGVSLAAIEKDTGDVIGVCFNKLQVESHNQSTYFEEYAANCKYTSAKALVQFMNDADGVVNLFELSNAKCLLELMFLAVLPEHRGKGIACKLCEYSLELGKELALGRNVKLGIDEKSLTIEPLPTAASAIFTSIVSQHIARKLNFIKAAEIGFDTFIFEGKSFASRIGPGTPTCTVEYKMLI